jgi:CMP-N,N'-diacetyllegionaminic acid synthase
VRVLALVAARGSSKRLPGKNIRVLGNKPLIVWSIDVAKNIPSICDILVSTDDDYIAKIALEAGAAVPWVRPPELATDSATSVDVALHALDWYERQFAPLDGLLLLQPTSPFRRRSSVMRGIDLFSRNAHRTVLGVSPAASHPMHCLQIEGDRLRPCVEGGIGLRSQDLPPAYALNGAFYLIQPANLRLHRAFFDADALALVMQQPGEEIDIDTDWDWAMAEAALERGLIEPGLQ